MQRLVHYGSSSSSRIPGNKQRLSYPSNKYHSNAGSRCPSLFYKRIHVAGLCQMHHVSALKPMWAMSWYECHNI